MPSSVRRPDDRAGARPTVLSRWPSSGQTPAWQPLFFWPCCAVFSAAAQPGCYDRWMLLHSWTTAASATGIDSNEKGMCRNLDG